MFDAYLSLLSKRTWIQIAIARHGKGEWCFKFILDMLLPVDVHWKDIVMY